MHKFNIITPNTINHEPVLYFDLGGAAGTIYIDDISFIEPVLNTNLITNGDFSDALADWQILENEGPTF